MSDDSTDNILTAAGLDQSQGGNVFGALPTAGASSPPNPLGSRSVLAYAHNPTATAGAGSPGPLGLMNVGSHVDAADLNPDFSSRIAKLQADAKAAGIDTNIISGYRSNEQQAQLYANYQNGTGGIAAPPGKSYHNSGNAVDMYATTPAGQKWLIANAPKYGIYPGANFGDPGHFQIAGNNPTGDHTGDATVASAKATGPANGATSPVKAGAVQGQGSSSDSTSAMDNPKGLYTLAMLQSLWPQAKFTPIDYNPFAVLKAGENNDKS